ncbi:Acb2/Tad1 domain-containing protein [Rhodococcus sp. NPDC003994]
MASRFVSRELTGEQTTAIAKIREACQLVAQYIEGNVPNGRYRAHAFTKLEEAMHWSEHGIAAGE